MLIDVDSSIPNLALMKLSAQCKNYGYKVDLFSLGKSAYKKSDPIYIDTSNYDFAFASVIFENNKDIINQSDICVGGIGQNYIELPEDIEGLDSDYSIYPDNDISYGFISRGCIRNCYFCKVPKKEGKLKQVSTIDRIVKHKKVKFLDNNFFALPNCVELMKELINKRIHYQFNQGLDIRLLDQEKSTLLSQSKLLGDLIFSFDDWKYLDIVEEKIRLLYWRAPFTTKFFVYTNAQNDIRETISRIDWLKDNQLLPYLMRDINCYSSPHDEFYKDLAAYCNQPGIFKKMTFEEFIRKRQPNNLSRQKRSMEIYYDQG